MSQIWSRPKTLSTALLAAATLCLSAIAAPATAGSSRPAAATGMHSVFQAKAQNRFWRILADVAPATSRAAATSVGRGRASVWAAR